jgi:hypothetical protein
MESAASLATSGSLHAQELKALAQSQRASATQNIYPQEGSADYKSRHQMRLMDCAMPDEARS